MSERILGLLLLARLAESRAAESSEGGDRWETFQQTMAVTNVTSGNLRQDATLVNNEINVAG